MQCKWELAINKCGDREDIQCGHPWIFTDLRCVSWDYLCWSISNTNTRLLLVCIINTLSIDFIRTPLLHWRKNVEEIVRA